MRKRLVCLTMVLLLVITLPCTALAAGTVLTVKTPDELPKSGETFYVTVDISGNPGVSAVQYLLKYDQTAMTCTQVTLGSALEGMLYASNPQASEGAMIASASTEVKTDDGPIGVFYFTANTDLTAWDFEIANVGLSDGNGNDVPFTTDPDAAPDDPETPEEPADPEQPEEPTEPEQPKEPKEPTEPEQPGDQETSGEEPDAGGSTEAAISFTDISGHWGEEYILRAAEMGLFNGYPDGTFCPDVEISRAEFVTVLWRCAGSPEPENIASFDDVAADAYYAKAVAWAKENGYVNGTSATAFDPTGILQRQAAIKILFFYHGGQSGIEMMLTGTYDEGFADSGEIASWAKAPMYWAYFNGVINGTDENHLSPQMAVTRGQAAKILVCYLEKTGK